MYTSQKLPMFTSSFSNNVSPTRFYVDDMMGYQVDDNLNPSNYHPYYNYQFPSPLIHDEIDGDHFSHHELALIQQSLRPNSSIVTDDSSTFEVTTKMMDSSKFGDQETVNGIVEDGSQNNEDMTRASASHGLKRRRTSKKDRHSKIKTAHGLRDRRMRLSLEVASPFFKLQDMLGYDKASSTVEWLLVQSKQAIEELYDRGTSIGHVSPNEVLTKCSMSNSNSHCEDKVKEVTNSKGRRQSTIAKDKKPKEKRKETTKESRNYARARARNRTLKAVQTRLRDHSNFDPFNYMMKECSKSNNSIETREILDHGSLTTEDWSDFTTFNYNEASKISQIVPSYKISIQRQGMMEGPR